MGVRTNLHPIGGASLATTLGAACALVAALAGCSEPVRRDPERADPLDTLSAGGTEPAVVRIGITPAMGEATDDELAPFLSYLEVEHGIRAEAVLAETYDALARHVEAEEVEVGVFSPLSYVKARDTMPAVAIATASRAGSPTYLGYVVVRRDAQAHELADLRGLRMAWVSESSTSGYLYPRSMMRDRGLDPDGFFAEETFVGDHLSAIDAVISGAADAAAVASAFVDNSEREGRPTLDHLRVIAKSDRIPLDSVVVHKSVARGLAVRLRLAFLTFDQDLEASSALADSWGVSGFVRANDARYDVIERVLDADRRAAQ